MTSRTYGIQASRLQAVGVGPVAPIATNQKDTGRANSPDSFVERRILSSLLFGSGKDT